MNDQHFLFDILGVFNQFIVKLEVDLLQGVVFYLSLVELMLERFYRVFMLNYGMGQLFKFEIILLAQLW